MLRIIEAGNSRYLSEIEELNGCLPDNVILNKQVTGCGLTSMALTEARPYVVCVPYVNLLKNKLAWCEAKEIEAIGVFDQLKGGASVEEIATFAGKKILVTWNSLPKVIAALGNRCKDYKILIDECHQLVSSGVFRYKAINELLDGYKEFGSFIFATASPVPDEYQLPELKSIPAVGIRWNNTKPVTIKYTKINKSIIKYAAGLALDFIMEVQEGNAHIFINSVKSITSICKALKAYSSDIRIVCADTEANQWAVGKIGKGFGISSTTDEVKKVNFYTSTAFEGCDIYDEKGRTIIVSDGSRDNTKIDIASTLPQILGRIRDTKINQGVVEFIYSTLGDYAELSESEYSYIVKQRIAETEKDIAEYNAMSRDRNRQIFLNGYANDPYIDFNGERAFVNTTVFYSEMAAYRTIHSNFYSVFCNDRSETTVNGTKHIFAKQLPTVVSDINKIMLGIKPSFKSLCNEYHTIRSLASPTEEDLHAMAAIAASNPLIKDAYETLGWDKMKALEFIQKNILTEVTVIGSRPLQSKVTSLLRLRVGKFYSSEQLKSSLSQVYNTLGIEKAAKASDLKYYYSVADKVIRSKQNESVRGYVVIGKNIH